MEGKSVLIYTLGGLAITVGIGVGIYFITKKPTVKTIDGDTQSQGGGSQSSSQGGGSQSSSQGGGSKSSSQSQSGSIISDTPDQVQYDIINYGDHLSAGSFPLKLGSKNKLVWDVQKALNDKFGAKLVTDGAFGEETAKAICSLAFKYCFTAVSDYRTLTLQKKHYDDILAGVKNTDFILPEQIQDLGF